MIKQEQIKDIREAFGLTQKMLAEMLHISLQTVKFYESRTRKASASVLDLLSYKIADLLNEQKKAKLR